MGRLFSRQFAESSLLTISPSQHRSRVYRTEAIVLKSFDYGEADRILTLYTPEQGKLRVLAKGVRRTTSRKAGHLDLFSRATLLLARGRQLDIITQAETVETFRPMRESLWRSTYAHYVAELVESFSAEQLPNYPLYRLAITALRHVATADNVSLAVRAFEVQLLSITGYKPQLHRCLHCDASIRPQVNRFSARLGGVLCVGCSSSDRAAREISVSALKVLRNLQTNQQAMLQITLSEEVQREVEKHLHEYLVYRLEAKPRSLGFLERLRLEGMEYDISVAPVDRVP